MLQWTLRLGQNVTVDVVNLDVTSRQRIFLGSMVIGELSAVSIPRSSKSAFAKAAAASSGTSYLTASNTKRGYLAKLYYPLPPSNFEESTDEPDVFKFLKKKNSQLIPMSRQPLPPHFQIPHLSQL